MDVCDIFSASGIMVRNQCDVPSLPPLAAGSECVAKRQAETQGAATSRRV